MYFIGIDIGTQGTRVVIADEEGNIIAKRSSKIEDLLSVTYNSDLFEQNPASWWKSILISLSTAINEFKSKDLNTRDIISISVDGTSGTLVLLGESNSVLRNAIMYKDNRSVAQSTVINNAGKEVVKKLGYKFKPSFALPKILWIKENEP